MTRTPVRAFLLLFKFIPYLFFLTTKCIAHKVHTTHVMQLCDDYMNRMLEIGVSNADLKISR